VNKAIYRHERGQSLIEFMLVVTLVVTLLLGVVDFALAYYKQVAIKNAVAEGGYYAIQHPDDQDGAMNQIKQELASFDPPVQDSDIVIACTGASGAEKTTIRVTYRHALMFNWIVPGARVTLGDTTAVPQIGGC
jgi:Flp pilus assembly protein TadG